MKNSEQFIDILIRETLENAHTSTTDPVEGDLDNYFDLMEKRHLSIVDKSQNDEKIQNDLIFFQQLEGLISRNYFLRGEVCLDFDVSFVRLDLSSGNKSIEIPLNWLFLKKYFALLKTEDKFNNHGLEKIYFHLIEKDKSPEEFEFADIILREQFFHLDSSYLGFFVSFKNEAYLVGIRENLKDEVRAFVYKYFEKVNSVQNEENPSRSYLAILF